MNTKKYFFSLFVLVSALSGFAEDPVPSQSADTNVVVLTEAQYAALTNNMGRLVASMSNVVDFIEFQVNAGVVSTNKLSDISSMLTNLRNNLVYLNIPSSFRGSVIRPTGLIGSDSQITVNSLLEGLQYVNENLVSTLRLFHLFINGSMNSAYDVSKYNFIKLFQLVEDIKTIANDILTQVTQIAGDVSVIKDTLGYIEADIIAINSYIQKYFPKFLAIGETGTNQLQTIIYIIQEMTNRVDNTDTNYYGDITNTLHDIAAGVSTISSIIGDGWEPGGGSWPPGGGGDGSTNSFNLSYFDKWLKDWVDKYFYPADSDYTAFYTDGGFLNPKYPSYGTPFHAAFNVPYFAADHDQYAPDISSWFRMENPYWGNAFNNTFQAFNSGHSNYYDIVSALLTDIQSVNAQNYALFYVLATNILLQSADVDVEETKQDVNALQEQIDSYSSDVETMKTDLEYKFNSLKNKYEDIKEKSDQIFSYLGGLARLPQQDYYFDLPKLQLGEDLEFGGMEITLPLTNQYLVTVAEILRFFSICLYWGLLISMIYYLVRGAVRMFILFFRFMLFMGAIGTDK